MMTTSLCLFFSIYASYVYGAQSCMTNFLFNIFIWDPKRKQIDTSFTYYEAVKREIESEGETERAKKIE